MKCTKNMLVIGGALFAAGLVAYIELPQFHPWIASAASLLILLLCPLSMMLMMKGMHSDQEQTTPSPGAQADKLLPQKSEVNK
jgi:DUF2933 family protein